MRTFIARPFGIRSDLNFDQVEAELIQPALQANELAGATTGEILAQGNIRVDMFQRLIASDLVIADITLNNPNVFYELGIRHGLRPRNTILIRGKAKDLPDVPFDLKTDRYLEYECADPKAACWQLEQVIRATLLNDQIADSPVHQLLPRLARRNTAELLLVPREFTEAVKQAKAENRPGDLKQLGEEIRTEIWECEGLRQVGSALRSLRCFETARAVWERVKDISRDDLEADIQLATILQRLDHLDESDLAVQRALSHLEATSAQKAELCSLLGSNLKTRWLRDWRQMEPATRALRALRSPFLEEMAAAYKRGLMWDPGHYYSAINTLASVALHLELAVRFPAEFESEFVNDAKAQEALAELEQARQKWIIAVENALESAAQHGDNSRWWEMTRADLELLRLSRPELVRKRYEKALAIADWFDVDSLDRQFGIFEELGILTVPVAKAREALQEAQKRLKRVEEPKKVILFVGHQIDEPGRKSPRFPAATEGKARQLIRDQLKTALEGVPLECAHAYAGCASGGDILFFEVCQELGIAGTVLLAAPRDLLVATSIAPVGSTWVQRLDGLLDKFPFRVLARRLEPPSWLSVVKQEFDEVDYLEKRAWLRSSRWILNQGLVRGASRITLIALWDGNPGDFSGGTGDMVSEARELGIRVVVIGTDQLQGTAETVVQA